MAEFKISLAAARVNAGKTQRDVGKHFNITPNTIANWENGKTSPSYAQFRELCDYYGIAEEYIFLPIAST